MQSDPAKDYVQTQLRMAQLNLQAQAQAQQQTLLKFQQMQQDFVQLQQVQLRTHQMQMQSLAHKVTPSVAAAPAQPSQERHPVTIDPKPIHGDVKVCEIGQLSKMLLVWGSASMESIGRQFSIVGPIKIMLVYPARSKGSCAIVEFNSISDAIATKNLVPMTAFVTQFAVSPITIVARSSKSRRKTAGALAYSVIATAEQSGISVSTKVTPSTSRTQSHAHSSAPSRGISGTNSPTQSPKPLFGLNGMGPPKSMPPLAPLTGATGARKLSGSSFSPLAPIHQPMYQHQQPLPMSNTMAQLMVQQQMMLQQRQLQMHQQQQQHYQQHYQQQQKQKQQQIQNESPLSVSSVCSGSPTRMTLGAPMTPLSPGCLDLTSASTEDETSSAGSSEVDDSDDCKTEEESPAKAKVVAAKTRKTKTAKAKSSPQLCGRAHQSDNWRSNTVQKLKFSPTLTAAKAPKAVPKAEVRRPLNLAKPSRTSSAPVAVGHFAKGPTTANAAGFRGRGRGRVMSTQSQPSARRVPRLSSPRPVAPPPPPAQAVVADFGGVDLD